MGIYNVKGAEISVGVTDSAVKTAVTQLIASGDISVSTNVGDTLNYKTDKFTPAIQTSAEAAYAAMLAKYQTAPNICVPFFLSTDQHSSGLEQHRWANNADVDGMEYVSINLGDTSNNVYEKAVLDGWYARTRHVKNYIGVVGNHDKRLENEEPLDSVIGKVFGTTNLKRTMISTDTRDCYTVVDPLRNVKWVVVDPFGDTDPSGAHGVGHTVYTIPSTVARWLIDVLSEDDGNDIVFLCHLPFSPTARTRSETEETAMPTDADMSVAWNICLSRKNKTSGSVVDDDGVTQMYDFTGCKTDVLCCLHGHLHGEYISTANGLTSYVADSWSVNKSVLFGIIDRASGKMHIYKVNGETVADELVIDIA